jgi:hypothetical protein
VFEAGLAQVDFRFDAVDARFDAMNDRFDRFEAEIAGRFATLEAKTDARLGALKTEWDVRLQAQEAYLNSKLASFKLQMIVLVVAATLGSPAVPTIDAALLKMITPSTHAVSGNPPGIESSRAEQSSPSRPTIALPAQ